MKYRIYRPKLPNQRERLQSGNKIGLTASMVMEELDMEATPAKYEQVFSGQVLEEAGAMAAISDPTIRKKATAGDILVLKGKQIKGAWLIDRMTKSHAQIQELPQFYRAVMEEFFRKELEHPSPGTKATPLDTRKDLNRMGKPDTGLKLREAYEKAVADEERGGQGGGASLPAAGSFMGNPLDGENQEIWEEADEDSEETMWHEESKKSLVEKMKKLQRQDNKYDIFLVNGFLLHGVKIKVVGKGWMDILHSGKRQILFFTGISSIRRSEPREAKQDGE